MRRHSRRLPVFALVLLALSLAAGSLEFSAAARAQSPAPNAPIQIAVDLTQAQRRIYRARLTIPAAPGPLTLYYPKWIPGEHGPTGPIADLAGLKFTAAGAPLEWTRDDADMFTFHLNVPDGASAVDVELAYIAPAGSGGQFTASPSSSDKLAVLSWNTVLLYPAGRPASEIQFVPRLKIPAGWKAGTSLRPAREVEGAIEYSPVSLETLVDSPVLTGAHTRMIPLSSGEPVHELFLAADSEAALQMSPKMQADYRQLVAEMFAIFGARHYRRYTFLFALSDHIGSFGLEHHESSDNRLGEDAITNPVEWKVNADLLPHEYFHSWNAKYRRPADLATPDSQKVMRSSLLWIYEGLTQYYGEVLTARMGLLTPEEWRARIARKAAIFEYTRGREWRPLVDTATAAQILYSSRNDGASLRRGVDFYEEMIFIWLEADVIIRQQSGGKRSLDDVLRRFHGGQDTGPMVKPYRLDDFTAAMNDVAAYDWKAFFRDRIYRVTPQLPKGGLENAGWRLVYGDAPNEMWRAHEQSDEVADLRTSLGFIVKHDGAISDVIPGSPAAEAGLAPGMKILGVNGRKASAELLRAAAHDSGKGSGRIEIVAENAEFLRTVWLRYSGGERMPNLERDSSKPDLLSEILKPRAKRVPE